MLLLDKRAHHLLSGYDHLLRAQADLPRRWRGPLLAAYACRRADSKLDVRMVIAPRGLRVRAALDNRAYIAYNVVTTRSNRRSE